MKYYLKLLTINAGICVIIVAFCGCGTNAQKKTIIIPLHTLNYTDTSNDLNKEAISKLNFFLIQGFRNNKAVDNLVDSFAHKNKDPDFAKYAQYQMVFYKESDKTNVSNIQNNPRIIDRHSQDHDWVYSYKWGDGKFMYKWRIRNGKIIHPKQTIVVEDIPVKAR